MYVERIFYDVRVERNPPNCPPNSVVLTCNHDQVQTQQLRVVLSCSEAIMLIGQLREGVADAATAPINIQP